MKKGPFGNDHGNMLEMLRKHWEIIGEDSGRIVCADLRECSGKVLEIFGKMSWHMIETLVDICRKYLEIVGESSGHLRGRIFAVDLCACSGDML